MRRAPYVVIAVLGVVVVAETGACRAPTQAEITISTTVPCNDLGEVAIVVSGSPEESEKRSATQFYAAQTGHCDARTVGSLVVTPGNDRAAVLVIGAPEGASLAACAPPLYRGCIVARRAFSFIDATTLRIPVSLDVECRDVPCDAFTTCRKGFCLSAELDCSTESDCRLAGELPDGGIDKEAAVAVDGSPDPNRDGAIGAGGDGSADGSSEAGTDAGVDADDDGGVVAPPPPPPVNITCGGGGSMSCGGVSCPAPNGCCENVMLVDSLACTMQTASPCTGGINKGRRRYCCGDAWCSQYVDTPRCDSAPGTPGNCVKPL